jgi:hypothetical protein
MPESLPAAGNKSIFLVLKSFRLEEFLLVIGFIIFSAATRKSGLILGLYFCPLQKKSFSPSSRL